MCTVFLSFLGNRWPLSSPVSIFLTNSTCLSLCKGQKCFAARIGNDNFRGCSPLLTLQQEYSVSQFSRQPLTPFESRFDFSDLPNSLDHLQRPKTFRSANLRLRFPRQVAFCHALIFMAIFDYLSDSKPLSNSVLWFWTHSTQVNTCWCLKYSAARFRIANLNLDEEWIHGRNHRS